MDTMQQSKHTEGTRVLVVRNSCIYVADVPTCLLLNTRHCCQLLPAPIPCHLQQHPLPPHFSYIPSGPAHLGLTLSLTLPLTVSVGLFPSLSDACPCRRPLLSAECWKHQQQLWQTSRIRTQQSASIWSSHLTTWAPVHTHTQQKSM